MKKLTTQGKSAEVRSNKFTHLTSQRLNTGNLSYAYLVGLIEGDGWFGKRELHIVFAENDISFAYFIFFFAFFLN